MESKSYTIEPYEERYDFVLRLFRGSYRSRVEATKKMNETIERYGLIRVGTMKMQAGRGGIWYQRVIDPVGEFASFYDKGANV